MSWTDISDKSSAYENISENSILWKKAHKLIKDEIFSEEERPPITNIGSIYWYNFDGDLPLAGGADAYALNNTLVFQQFVGLINGVMADLPANGDISYEINVESLSGGGAVFIYHPSIDNGNYIWDSSKGTGSFTGTLPITSSGGNFTIDIRTARVDVVFTKIAINSSTLSITWADNNTSSTWTPVTDKTTVWS